MQGTGVPSGLKVGLPWRISDSYKDTKTEIFSNLLLNDHFVGIAVVCANHKRSSGLECYIELWPWLDSPFKVQTLLTASTTRDMALSVASTARTVAFMSPEYCEFDSYSVFF